jgi:hypothetical protein
MKKDIGVVDPELFDSDPDPAFHVIPDPAPSRSYPKTRPRKYLTYFKRKYMYVNKDEWDLFSQFFLAKQVGSGAGTIFPDPDMTSPKTSGYAWNLIHKTVKITLQHRKLFYLYKD